MHLIIGVEKTQMLLRNALLFADVKRKRSCALNPIVDKQHANNDGTSVGIVSKQLRELANDLDSGNQQLTPQLMSTLQKLFSM